MQDLARDNVLSFGVSNFPVGVCTLLVKVCIYLELLVAGQSRNSKLRTTELPCMVYGCLCVQC